MVLTRILLIHIQFLVIFLAAHKLGFLCCRVSKEHTHSFPLALTVGIRMYCSLSESYQTHGKLDLSVGRTVTKSLSNCCIIFHKIVYFQSSRRKDLEG